MGTQQGKTRSRITSLLGAIVTLVVFGYLFSTVSKEKFLLLIREISALGLLAFILLSLSGSLLRAWRYQTVLRWSGHNISSLHLFLITLIRNFCADLLPARIGTTVYILLLNKKVGVPLPCATSSFSLALLFDFLTLPLIFLVFLYGDTQPELHNLLTVLMVITLALAGIGTWHLPAITEYLAQWSARSVSPLAQKMSVFVHRIASDVTIVRNPSLLLQLIVLSLFIRLFKYLSLIIFLYALLIPLGMSPEELPFAHAFFGILTSELSASLPISGIGGFGLYEGTWAFTFRQLGLPGEIADVTALTHHLFTQVYGYVLGFIGLLLLFTLPAGGQMPLLSLPGRLVFPLRISFAFVMLWVGVALAQSESPSPKGKRSDKRAPPAPAVEHFSEKIPDGYGIVYDSNVSGNFGLYFINNQKRSAIPLLDSEMHEMYPDVSDAWNEIAFARARTTQRLEPGSIWILSAQASSPTLIARDGTFPTFIQNSGDIVFERRRSEVMVWRRATQKVEKLFPSAKNSPFRGHQVVKPRVSDDGRYLVFTSDRPSAWHAWIVDLETEQASLIQPGCEPALNPSNTNQPPNFFGVYVQQSNAIGGSGIFSFQRETSPTRAVIDYESRFSHEYFPTVDPSGRWLLFGACPPDQHSHESANYEIFMKDLRSAAPPMRITKSAHTNRWPKLTRTNWAASRAHLK